MKELARKVSRKLPSRKSRKHEELEPPELKKFRKSVIIGVVLSIAGIAVIAVAVFWPEGAKKSSLASENNDLANSESQEPLIDKCESEKNTTFKCYKTEIEAIVRQQGPKRAMDLIKQQYPKVSYVKTQCHQLVHVVGRAAYVKYGNMTDTYANGDQFCWSGYYHGAIEELSNKRGFDYLVKKVNEVCKPIADQGKNSFKHYNCVHGMGHGFMFILDGELFDSLKACDNITDSWERTSCYGGVFMQNIMNEQAPDKDPDEHSKYLRATEPMYPCTAIDDKYKNQCYLMQTSYALQTVSYDFKKVFELCDQIEEAHRNTCYMSLGRDASGTSISDAKKTKETCLLGPTNEAQKQCIFGAAYDFVSYFHSDKQALELCASLPSNLVADCTSAVNSYYTTF